MPTWELQYPDKRSPEAILGQNPTGRIEAQSVEPSSEHAMYEGDNQALLLHLLPQLRGQVDLIYIDPPFGTGQDFNTLEEELAYADQLVDHHFLEFLRQRLYLLRECLSPRGTIYLHIDKKIGHYVKLIMDEVWGAGQFLNDITRIKCNPKNFARKAYGNASDMILVYAQKHGQHIWNEVREPLSESDRKRLFPKEDPQRGAYTTHPLHAPGITRNGDTGQDWKGMPPPKGRHWRYGRQVLDELDEAGLIEWSESGNPRKRVFAEDHPGKKIQDVWEFKDKGRSYVSYPTEKNHALLARIIQQSSHPGSLVLDAFAGSGGTLMVAANLGRRFLGMDRSPEAWSVIAQNLAQKGIDFSRYRLIL